MSTSTSYSQPWTKEALCQGDGFIVEGVLRKVKMHSMFLTGKHSVHDTVLPTRFITIVLEVDTTIKRNWKDGYEVPPKMTRATAISKGYLNKFDRVQANLVEKFDSNGLAKAIGGSTGKAIPMGFHDDSLPSLHPARQNYFEFWLDAEKNSHKDLKVGDELRVKTMGNSIFAESMIKMDSHQISNMAGDTQVLSAWQKNMLTRADAQEEAEPSKESEEDDDADWS
eukprot:gene6520-7550_t